MTALERIAEAATRLVTATTEDEYLHAYSELCAELGHDEAHHDVLGEPA